MAISYGQQSNLDRLTLVVNAGWVNLPAAMNPAQAALLSAFAILAVTIAASWLPARRAASVEPMQALRTE